MDFHDSRSEGLLQPKIFLDGQTDRPEVRVTDSVSDKPSDRHSQIAIETGSRRDLLTNSDRSDRSLDGPATFRLSDKLLDKH